MMNYQFISMMVSVVIVVIGFSSMPNLILAQTGDVARLPEVVVTATRSDTLVEDVPYSVEALDGAVLKMERMARSLPESLRETSGVMAQKTAYGQGSPYIRGFTGFRTVLMIDGIRLNNSVFREGPNQYWNTVDHLTIDRLEVVKGPSSVLYGSDAIGGTVNAITKRRAEFGPTLLWDGLASYRYASADDSHTGRGEISASLDERLGLILGATIKSFRSLRAGNGIELPATGYDEWDGDAKVEYRLTAESRLTVAYQRVDQDDIWRTHRTIYAIPYKDTTVGTDFRHVFDQTRDLAYAQYEATNLVGAVDRVWVSLSWQKQSETLDRIRSDLKRDKQGFDVNTLGASVVLSSSSPVGDWTYGGEYYRDWVNSYRLNYNADGTFASADIQGPVADAATYDLVGVFAQDRIPLTEQIELILGARYNYARADANQVRDPVTSLPFSITDDWHNAVGSGRVLWHVDDEKRWTLFGGASQGFRAPNLSDLTRLDTARSGELETPSPGLDPEYYVSFEAGIRSRFETLAVEVSYYHTFIEGMIVRAPTGRMINGLMEVTKRNAGDGYIHGMEAGATWRMNPQWAVFGWITWMEGRVDGYPTSSPERQTEPVSRLMPLTGLIGLRWEHPNKILWAECVTIMADRQDKLSAGDLLDTQRIPSQGTPGYATLSLRAGWRPHPRVNISAALENVTDKYYRVHGSGLNEPGRNAIVAAEIKL